MRGTTVLPGLTKEVPAPIPPAHCDSGGDVAYIQQVLSFGTLFETLKMLNEKFAPALNGNITLAGMLLRGMSQHPFLRDEKIKVVVDVPPDPQTGQPQTVYDIGGKGTLTIIPAAE